jgi:hypothetical protein
LPGQRPPKIVWCRVCPSRPRPVRCCVVYEGAGARGCTIALDVSSRTSVALARILCARRFEIALMFEPSAGPPRCLLHDAALFIDDPSCCSPITARLGLARWKIDPGRRTAMTGLPFVWGSGPAGPIGNTAEARETGAGRQVTGVTCPMRSATHVAATPRHRDLARRYLRENIQFNGRGACLTAHLLSRSRALGLPLERRTGCSARRRCQG